MFCEKGRLVCPIENGVIDNVGMLFRTNNINLKAKSNRNTHTENKCDDLTT